MIAQHRPSLDPALPSDPGCVPEARPAHRAAERSIVAAHAGEVIERMGGAPRLVGVGPLDPESVLALVDAIPNSVRAIRLHVVDPVASRPCQTERVLAERPRVSVHPQLGESCEAALRRATTQQTPRGRVLVLAPAAAFHEVQASDPRRLFRWIRGALWRGDGLLFGADLLEPGAPGQDARGCFALDRLLAIVAAAGFSLDGAPWIDADRQVIVALARAD